MTEPLDQLIQSAMQARHVTVARRDLAQAALERARDMELRAGRLEHIGRWIRRSSLAAGLLLGVIVVGAVYFSPADTSTSGGTYEQASDTVNRSSSSSSDLAAGALVLLGATVVGLGMKMVLLPEQSVLATA